MPDEVARIGALSNGSNGQRSLESASLHFEPVCRHERGEADREPAGEILSQRRSISDLEAIWPRELPAGEPEHGSLAGVESTTQFSS